MKVLISLDVKDTVTAKYMRQNNVFADAFNYFVYNGRQVIDPNSLEELDTREVEVPYGGEEGAEQLSIVPDYRINLIAPATMDDSDFDKFSSTLKEVLSFIKYSGNGDELIKVVNSNQEFRHLGRTEIDVLNACVNANLTMKQDEEVLDVCQAIQTIADRAEEKGRIEALRLTVKILCRTWDCLRKKLWT